MEINLVKIIHKLGSDFGNAILSGLVVLWFSWDFRQFDSLKQI